MSTLPPTVPPRSPRARLAAPTPAVFRLPDGRSSRGDLQIISATGGLVSLPKPLDRGSRVMLMFLTQNGTVLGSAEMLKPVSWDLQPFRFISLDETNRVRLKTAVRGSLAQNQPEYDWVHSYRAKMSEGKPTRRRLPRAVLAALTLATAGLGSILLYSAYLK